MGLAIFARVRPDTVKRSVLMGLRTMSKIIRGFANFIDGPNSLVHDSGLRIAQISLFTVGDLILIASAIFYYNAFQL